MHDLTYHNIVIILYCDFGVVIILFCWVCGDSLSYNIHIEAGQQADTTGFENETIEIFWLHNSSSKSPYCSYFNRAKDG